MQRSSGILMPIFSLPSPYGIGTIGKAAYDFIDFLSDAGQAWWQILPVGPTSVGNSPYQSPSAYAGNPYFIDLDLLIADNLLTEKEVTDFEWGTDPAKVDYNCLYNSRLDLLKKAVQRGWDRDRELVKNFEEENRHWLPDYALYMSLKRHFSMLSWPDWPEEDIRMHREEAVERYRSLLQEEIRVFTYLQFLFFQQWKALREYAEKKRIRILGDMALYVGLDSADVWASPENFRLDEKHIPTDVAGVPPDYFCEEGQLWGNPLYDYEYMKKDGFGWWIRRIGGAEKLYDALRIDHFRGLESYWAVPQGEKTAINGRWMKGPGMELLGMLQGWFHNMQFIAEDLGILTPDVERFREESGLPGMKVLEFAFSTGESSSYLPHAHVQNCVCYVGTHDNDTILGWKKHEPTDNLMKAIEYLGLNDREGFVWGMLRGGMSSVADLFIAQMQDYLELDEDARINIPGTMYGNWEWRMLPGQNSRKLAERICKMTELYNRKCL